MLKRVGVDPSSVALLISFPRSANGWVRFVLSLHHLVFVEQSLPCESLGKVVSRSLSDKTGLASPGIIHKNELLCAQDLLVPDIYMYAQVLKRTADWSLKPSRRPIMFKTHHLIDTNSRTSIAALLLRDPVATIYSAAHLLFPDVMNDSKADKMVPAKFLLEIYAAYLDQYEKLLNLRRAVAIDVDRLPETLAGWLVRSKSEMNFSDDQVRKQLETIVALKPRQATTEALLREHRPEWLPDLRTLLNQQRDLIANSPSPWPTS